MDFKYIFPKEMTQFYVDRVLRIPFYEPTLTTDYFTQRPNPQISTLIMNNVILKLWLVCNMDMKFLKEHNLQFNSIRKQVLEMEFSVNAFNIIPMIFLEILLNESGEVSGEIITNASDLYFLIRTRRLQQNLITIPNHDSTHDEDNIICDLLQAIIERHIPRHGRFRISLVNSMKHVMLAYLDKKTSNYYLCNSGDGLKPYHPKVIVEPDLSFYQCILPLPNSPAQDEMIYRRLSVEQVYKSLGLPVLGDGITRVFSNQSYYTIGYIRFFIHDDLLYIIPQIAGTCSYYAIMIFLIVTLHSMGWGEQKIQTYFTLLFDDILESITISSFISSLEMSKAHAFLHLLRMKKSKKVKAMETKFRDYRMNYLQYRCNQREMSSNPNIYEFVLIPKKTILSLIWDNVLTRDSWFSSNYVMEYASSTYGKIFLQHYMNRVRDFWLTEDVIPKDQFRNVVDYLYIMLSAQHYYRARQDHEMYILEGRQLSMTFYYKFKTFIRNLIPANLHMKWNRIASIPLSDQESWFEDALEFIPFFNTIFKVEDHYQIRMIAIMENVLSPNYYPAMFTTGLTKAKSQLNYQRYFYYENKEPFIPILEFPLQGSATDLTETSINIDHDAMQIETLQSELIDYSIMVRNYLSNGFVFNHHKTPIIHRLLLLCSHYRVTLQIQNVLVDNNTVELWRIEDVNRFYYYCWALLMCKDKQYGDKYVLKLMGAIPDKYHGQCYILLHLHNHEKYLRKFCRADSVFYEPLKIHLLLDSHGVFQPYIPQIRNGKSVDYYQLWNFQHETEIRRCIDYKGSAKIMGMINVLREMATVVVYEQGDTKVIDVSAHESELGSSQQDAFVTKHRWIYQQHGNYWQLENSDWRMYEKYDLEMELEWITYGQTTGCIMLLKKQVMTSKKEITYQYGLFFATNKAVANPGTKFWKYSIEQYQGKKLFTIMDTIITKTIDLERRDMITPIIKDIDTFLHLWILLQYYISPLSNHIFGYVNSLYNQKYANANSFITTYGVSLETINQKSIPSYLLEWIVYWNTQQFTIPSDVDVHEFWYSQGGLTPNPYQKEEIHNLIYKKSTCMRQYIMGVGKSSVIIPHLVLHYLQHALQQPDSYRIILIQPVHLVNAAFIQLSKLGLIKRVTVVKEFPKTHLKGNVYIYVFSDIYLKQRWKKIVETETLQINVLIIDEFDSVCMPCRSDFNVCADLVRGVSHNDHQHPDMIQWLQYESPHMFIEQLPLREVSFDDFCTLAKSFDYHQQHSKNQLMFKQLHQVYNSCVKWNFNVEYGFRLTGTNASPFAVPFITTNTPDPVSEYQSNEVRLIASCLALRQQKKLLPVQQHEFTQQISFLTQIGLLSNVFNTTLSTFVSYCLFPKLHYSRQTENVNMTDILLSQPNRIIYGFSGTVAIPTYKELQINCITYDPTFPKISYMLETKLSKHTAPHFTDKEYQHYLKKKYPKKYKHFPTHEIDATWEATTNVQLPDQRVVPIHDSDSIWSSLTSFDVIIDSCGFFKNRNHMKLVEQMNIHLKRPIVYIDPQHMAKVYPGNYNYPYSNLDTNFTKPQHYPNYLFYFDHSHIVGTDIKHPKQLQICVFTNVTSKEYVVVQAMYRIRGVHDPQNQHYIKFAIDVEQIINNNKVLDVQSVDEFSLRKIARLWKFNQSKEVGINKTYLKYQYKFALYKINKKDWNIQKFHQSIQYNHNVVKPINLQATVQNNVTVNVNVNLSQMMTQDQSILDRSGIKMKVLITSGELTNIGTIMIVKGTFISDFCYKYILSSKQNNRLLLFLVKSMELSLQVIISGEELQDNISSFNAVSHRISNIYGHQLFPTFKSSVDWILPSLTHAPTISFYSLLETMHNVNIVPEYFFPLQILFQTTIPLFNPIITWNGKRQLQSNVLDKLTLHQFQRKLESKHGLLPTIRKILGST